MVLPARIFASIRSRPAQPPRDQAAVNREADEAGILVAAQRVSRDAVVKRQLDVLSTKRLSAAEQHFKREFAYDDNWIPSGKIN